MRNLQEVFCKDRHLIKPGSIVLFGGTYFEIVEVPDNKDYIIGLRFLGPSFGYIHYIIMINDLHLFDILDEDVAIMVQLKYL